jgi:hypothetical protein
MRTFPCPLCFTQCEIQSTKKDKPYLTCADCGVQLFIRYDRGIERLEALSRNKSFVLQEFVVCQKCQVAVRRSPNKITHPIFGPAGIYCPECDELLLKQESL